MQEEVFAQKPSDGEPWDAVIIGSGPAAFTAAIYTTRGAASTLILAGENWGGQLMLTTTVDNYPGFPEGIPGPQLITKMKDQAMRFGAEFVAKNVVTVDFKHWPFELQAGDETYLASSVIIATGAQTKWLDAPGIKEFIGRGVSSCAPCDAPFFKGKKVVVVGGGDSAMEEALILAQFASEVTLIHRRDQFSASKIMQDKVLANPKIKVIWNTVVVEVIGKVRVEEVALKTSQAGQEKIWNMPLDGIFVAIGSSPNTDLFAGQLQLDAKGYTIRGLQPGELLHPSHTHEEPPHETQVVGEHHPYRSSTSVPGVFVAGDVHDHHFRQAVTAAGYGCEAAMDVLKYFEEMKPRNV